MRWRRLARACALALAVTAAPAVAPAGQAEQPEAGVWIQDELGRRFRARFDTQHRLFAGVGAAATSGGGWPLELALEAGLSLRAPLPPPDTEVVWKRDHQLAHLRLRQQADGTWLQGQLYHGVYLRHSREGSLTIPTSPPLRLGLPFDVGVRVEVGRVAGPLSLRAGGDPFEVGVVRGEAIADLLRSPRPGRWLALGLVGAYDVRWRRGRAGGLDREHVVTPMTAAAASARAESQGGLVAASARAEWSHPWSSRAGWHQRVRGEAALEVTPVAVNDLPLSVVLAADAEALALPGAPARVRVLLGVRLGAPWAGR